jgi:hypothetical protein
MHVIKADEALPCQLSYKRNRDTLVVVALDDFQEVYSKDFKNHDEMLAIRSMVNKRV